MKTVFGVCLVFGTVSAAAQSGSTQSPAISPTPSLDSLYVSGEASAGPAFSGGGGAIDWVHVATPRSVITVGGASLRLGADWWTYGTVGGTTRRRDLTFSGNVGAGWGGRGQERFPYVRVMGGAAVPVRRGLSAETEAQFLQLNGTGVKVFKGGTVFGGLPKTDLRLAYYGALVPGQFWQYLLARGDVRFGRPSAFGGFTTGHGRTPLPLGGPDVLLHSSQEVFLGGSIPAGNLRAISAAQIVRQAGTSIVRVTVSLQLPLESQTATRSRR